MSEREQRRLVAIVAADVAGFSRLIGADEEGTLSDLRAHRHELIDPLLAEYVGRIANTAGDSLLLEFPSAVNAVRFSVAVQKGMAARNSHVPTERRIEYRIGINVGDVVAEGDDLLGDGVNVAARLEGLAEPGGICISRTVRDQVRDRFDFALEDMGEVEVKNIARPVRAFHVLTEPGTEAPARKRTATRRWPAVVAFTATVIATVGAIVWWQAWKPDREPASVERVAFPLPDKPSIAVLPFANLSDDPQQEYFADGMTDDLITDLSKISGLFVIARNSSFSFKGKSIDVKQVARKFGVRYILEGSVRRSGDQIRINTQLVDAATGGQIWAERYDERVDNVFALQDQVAREVIAALKVKLTVGDEESLEHRPRPINLEAYEWLLQGRKELAVLDRKSTAQAKVFFERAIEADPSYARAYTNLGLYYWREWRIWGRGKEMNLKKAKDVGRKAVELDSLSAGARVLLAVAHQTDGEHLEADKWGSEALRLKPTQAETLGNLGAYLLNAGRYKKAIVTLSNAVRLDPLHPPQWLSWLGHAYFMSGETPNAIKVLKAGIARGPDYIAYHLFLAASYAIQDEHEIAQAEAQEVLRLNSGFTVTAYQRYAMGNTKNENAVHRMVAALRKAGLPE